MLARIVVGAFDVLVVGGGATGLGVAVDSAQRGYNTCLLEAFDFAKGTSSRTTKLVHGGVRYLQQLDFQLVVEALRERGLMHENAPHLVHPLRFVIPRYGRRAGHTTLIQPRKTDPATSRSAGSQSAMDARRGALPAAVGFSAGGGGTARAWLDA